jgi:hypothetical protein
MELFSHSSIRLHGVVLNLLIITFYYLPLFLVWENRNKIGVSFTVFLLDMSALTSGKWFQTSS